ncbi:preprotein translocase subunit SecE [Candidatus Saccharibacteria bacterium]|nr:preprotein translocase subunit SecE [Candidatus Saccharibacteria bacterium]
MATKVTRIKAKDDGPKTKSEDAEKITRKVSVKAKNSESKKTKIAAKKAEKAADKDAKKSLKKADGKEKKVGYFRGAFRELRQVRWPNRKETWKMTLSVIIYVVILAAAIMLLDALLQLIFNQLLGGK